jgi:hypothetical protein
VDLTDFGQRQKSVVGPAIGTQCLPVDPLRGVCVSGDLKVVFELFVSDSPTIAEECFYLTEDESVAFDRRRAMCLLIPDLCPNILCLDRQRQSAETLA